MDNVREQLRQWGLAVHETKLAVSQLWQVREAALSDAGAARLTCVANMNGLTHADATAAFTTGRSVVLGWESARTSADHTKGRMSIEGVVGKSPNGGGKRWVGIFWMQCPGARQDQQRKAVAFFGTVMQETFAAERELIGNGPGGTLTVQALRDPRKNTGHTLWAVTWQTKSGSCAQRVSSGETIAEAIEHARAHDVQAPVH